MLGVFVCEIHEGQMLHPLLTSLVIIQIGFDFQITVIVFSLLWLENVFPAFPCVHKNYSLISLVVCATALFL